MLHKPNNPLVTLAILLALVGVTKPAEAFLLARADATPETFTVPEQLSEEATIKIAASNSIESINQSLKESFIAKYPQAEVDLEIKSSEKALEALSKGKVDLVGIGRDLTAAEQQQGLVAVPISREKIAIVVSPDNHYHGSLTISQFAQIFRGEITDWSELNGTPGEISLVDLPDSNDTRQAFTSYPVFQEGEFTTGDNATKLHSYDIDKIISRLGSNGIGYAVANDVIDRDDVKILSMYETRPDDLRYPFSQPFYLVYRGTPSETSEAFLGFATAEGGEQAIANRLGSVAHNIAHDIAVQYTNTVENTSSAAIAFVFIAQSKDGYCC